MQNSSLPDPLPEQINSERILYTNIETKEGLFDRLYQRTNNWSKIQRVSLLVITACNKFKEKISSVNRKSNIIESRKEAKNLIVKDCQQTCFNKLHEELQKGIQPSDKQVLQWSPFIDEDGLIRVGGRSSNGPFTYDEKYPLLIPYDHQLSYCLALHYHIKCKHQGRLITSGIIKSSGFFIQHCSKLIKKLINECYICRKLRAPTEFQKMSDLPEERLTKTPPFTHCGIDVCGPFDVRSKMTTRKNVGTNKVWILIITCLYSRATHTEILPSMDTSSFINAYRRFVSIRGPCKKLMSDCGSNFLSARNIDSKFSFESFKDELNQHETEWDLIPPHASHFGGSWERKVGSLKQILNATLNQLGSRYLSHDEFITLVAEATCIMNNTPLHDIIIDPNETIPLTPSLLLTNKPIATPPPLEEFSPTYILAYCKNRYKRVQHLADYFWQQCQNTYLTELNKRKKWQVENKNLKINESICKRK